MNFKIIFISDNTVAASANRPYYWLEDFLFSYLLDELYKPILPPDEKDDTYKYLCSNDEYADECEGKNMLKK